MHKNRNRVLKSTLSEIGSFKVNAAYLVFLLAFFLTPMSMASWEERIDWKVNFENVDLDESLKSIKIEAFPLTRTFQISIWFRSHSREPREGFKTPEDLRAFLRDSQFNVGSPTAGLEDLVFVEIPITNPQRAKELIDGLNQFEPILPLTMVDKMKLAVESALQGSREHMPPSMVQCLQDLACVRRALLQHFSQRAANTASGKHI